MQGHMQANGRISSVVVHTYLGAVILGERADGVDGQAQHLHAAQQRVRWQQNQPEHTALQAIAAAAASVAAAWPRSCWPLWMACRTLRHTRSARAQPAHHASSAGKLRLQECRLKTIAVVACLNSVQHHTPLWPIIYARDGDGVGNDGRARLRRLRVHRSGLRLLLLVLLAMCPEAGAADAPRPAQHVSQGDQVEHQLSAVRLQMDFEAKVVFSGLRLAKDRFVSCQCR
jgi:hypothetical protein